MILFEKSSSDIIDVRNTMYPSFAQMLVNSVKQIDCSYSTVYGFSYGNSNVEIDGDIYALKAGEFFSIPVRENKPTFSTQSSVFIVVRMGFIGQHVIGKIEKTGRLSYIDGCSDTMLVYPPRFGDPSLNYLHFPSNINQSFHTHPSIRIGIVVDGEGYSTLQDKEIKLSTGCIFSLEEQELHRFRTENTHMNIIAFHPDGEWGPTDENHTMLNRTYLAGK